MKKLFLTLLFAMFLVSSFSQDKFFVGGSSGITGFAGDIGYNVNLFPGYFLTEDISIGIDGWYGNVKSNELFSATLYFEAGHSLTAIKLNEDRHINFTSALGPGYIQARENGEKQDGFSFLLGVNVNFILHPQFSFGIKTCSYLSALDDNPVNSNLYIRYRF